MKMEEAVDVLMGTKKACPECHRLERENAALRLEMKTMAEHQVVLMDALDAVKNSTHAMRVVCLTR